MTDNFFFNIIFPDIAEKEVIPRFVNGDVGDVINCDSEDEISEMFLERNVIKANLHIESDRYSGRYDSIQMYRFKEKIRDFIFQMDSHYHSEDTIFTISAFVENGIKVTFRRRQDISLTLYDNHIEKLYPDYEEAFLSYAEGPRTRLEYNTMPEIVRLLKELI